MSKEIIKKAADMLLKGATLLGTPCPYCNGVRVIHDGHALCISCGREPESKIVEEKPQKTKNMSTILETKLDALSNELEHEADHKKQQDILKSINLLLETIKKIQNKE